MDEDSVIIRTVVSEDVNPYTEAFTLLVVLFLISLVVFLSRNHYYYLQRKKGFFPVHIKFNKKSLMTAYISLSANMIRRDLTDNKAKADYLNQYLRKEFRESHHDFTQSLHFSLRYPVRLNSVCDWLNIHLTEEIYRLQIIYLLAGMSMMNGKIVANEYRLLQDLTRLLHLNEKDLDSIVAMYMKQDRRSQKRSESRRKSATRTAPSLRKQKVCLQILGLASGATAEEIKKAYRKLAMLHHPDKFEKVGGDQLRLAKERFLKIQEAYEYLEKK